MCLVLHWPHGECTDSPGPPRPHPGHPAQRVPDQVTTSSPNPLGVTGPSVLGCQVLPPSSP